MPRLARAVAAGRDVLRSQPFNYDPYANLLGSPTPQTNLLYAGEMIEPDIGWYYNRACSYDPATGRFNTTDPFAGNQKDLSP